MRQCSLIYSDFFYAGSKNVSVHEELRNTLWKCCWAIRRCVEMTQDCRSVLLGFSLRWCFAWWTFKLWYVVPLPNTSAQSKVIHRSKSWLSPYWRASPLTDCCTDHDASPEAEAEIFSVTCCTATLESQRYNGQQTAGTTSQSEPADRFMK